MTISSNKGIITYESNLSIQRSLKEPKEITDSFALQLHLNSRKPLFKLKNAVLRIISFKRLQRRNIAVGEHI